MRPDKDVAKLKFQALLLAFFAIFCLHSSDALADNAGNVTYNIVVTTPPIIGTFTFNNEVLTPFGVPTNLSLLGPFSYSIIFDEEGPPVPFTETVTNTDLELTYSGLFLGDFTDLLSGDWVPTFVEPSQLTQNNVFPEGIQCLVDAVTRCVADCTTATPTFETRRALNCFEEFVTNKGNNKTVSTTSTYFDPLSQTTKSQEVEITFPKVNTKGDTVVAASSNSASQLSFGFSVLAVPIFVEITTTAEFDPPATVCLRYIDDDNDGIVDGTTVLAANLRMLHEESSVMVDVTNLPVDTANKFVCGDVSSFSQILMATPTADDPDGDGVPTEGGSAPCDSGFTENCDDNCPINFNPDQQDTDGDGFGDVCDLCPIAGSPDNSDSDGDGIGNACDNCLDDFNPSQSDCDGDLVGDACDVDTSDSDADGVDDACDNCPLDFNPEQEDDDSDLIGDICDPKIATEEFLAGRSFKLGLGSKPSSNSIKAFARVPELTLGDGNGSLDDPTIHGATLTVASNLFLTLYDLPADNWTCKRKTCDNRGYKYKAPKPRTGIRSVKISIGNKSSVLRVSGRGEDIQHSLSTNPDPTTAELCIGQHCYCMNFGGEIAFSADRSFKAKNSAQATNCVE